jgi:hypothetical protein
MIYRSIFTIAFFSLLACKAKVEKDAIPELLGLEIIDSILIQETEYFINGQKEVIMLGDSLIAVSSIKSPSVGFFEIYGKQRKRIASGDYPIGSFMPSNFDATYYPIVYLLDKKSESVLVFNVITQEFIKKIRLKFPEGKEAKFVGSKFKKLESGFLIELASSIFDNYDPAYYRESGQLIYRFSEEGQTMDKSFLEYPKELKEIRGSLNPIDYLVFTAFKESWLFSFPHSQKILRYDRNDFGKLIEEIQLPKSRFFDYNLEGSEQIVSFQEMFNSGEGTDIVVPLNHYFKSIFENERQIIITTWMNNREDSPNNGTFTNLLIYTKDTEKWHETSNPRNILDIGMLAGVVNDTLYFYEGSLMKHDEKYIKRAVLRPIDDL